MDDAALTALLAECAKADPDTREGLEAVSTLEEALKGEPEFDKPRLFVNGRGAYNWHPQAAAQKLISLVRRGRDPAGAVIWLRKVPSINQGAGGAIKLLYGVRCEHPVAMANDIVLLPFKELPASEMLDWIVKEHERASQLSIFHGFTPAPSAALYRPGVVAPLVHERPEDGQNRSTALWFDELDAAARLLSLIPKTIPIEAFHWLHFDDPDVALLAQFGLSRQGPELQPSTYNAPVEVRAPAVEGLMSGYLGLASQKDRGRIDLALERLIRSRCQFVSGNRAIDLAIALEVLFMNADGGEHSYKISLRAAWLVGSAAPARRKTFLLVRRLYDMRSSMVHTGNVKNEYSLDEEKVSAHEIVEAVDVVCTEAIRKLLGRGGIPSDWRGIELGE